MKSFKNKLKYAIGDNIIFIVKDIKNKIIPGRAYFDEIEENKKRKIFYSQFVESDDLCFDIGANVGNRVSPLLELGAKIIAFEPQSSCRKILKWKFGKRIKIDDRAMGSSEGVMDMYISNFSGISSLSQEWINSVKNTRFQNFEWGETEKVKVNTIDQAIKEYGIPKFIKIDVEGYELEVLNGLSVPIDMISFEYATPEQTKRAIDCIERIALINANSVFNYSVGESMNFALNTWINADDMIKLVSGNEFSQTLFGDIYAKN